MTFLSRLTFAVRDELSPRSRGPQHPHRGRSRQCGAVIWAGSEAFPGLHITFGCRAEELSLKWGDFNHSQWGRGYFGGSRLLSKCFVSEEG